MLCTNKFVSITEIVSFVFSKNPCKVVSKYFTNSVMDDSLSDFKAKKKFTGPKKLEKPKVGNVKSKKVLKRIKGLKDIRTVLCSKKNELVSYSNDFDKICKQSGIDVDSEQLQLAVALSKSLQSTENPESSGSQSTAPLSSQERTGKIRITLQEYGFKVPEIKLTAPKKKRLKVRKQYKLLLSTEAEKAQIISDRYAQVLLENLDSSCYTDQVKSVELQLYQKATQIAFEYLKNNKTFYVEDLFEHSGNTVGSLLRDWSEIPGRPSSPNICEPLNIHFNELDWTQEELDSILSGTLGLAQTIIKTKQSVFVLQKKHSASEIISNLEDTIKKQPNMEEERIKYQVNDNTNRPELATTQENYTKEIREYSKNNAIDLTKIEGTNIQSVTKKARSCSPDIFDDEVSSLMDISKENDTPVSQNVDLKDATGSKTDFMDLTECINALSQKSLKYESRSDIVNSQLSQGSNRTRQKSNDFMEITNCVAGSSQPLLENIDEENIDLTQLSDERTEPNDNKHIPSEDKANQVENKEVESMDLTQSSYTDDELPFVQMSGANQNSLDDTIILNEDVYIGINKDPKQSILIDDDEFQAISVKNSKLSNGNLNLIAPDHQNPINSITIDSEDETEKLQTSFSNYYEMSEPKQYSHDPVEDSHTKIRTQSFFDSFIHQHFDDAVNESKNENSNYTDDSNQVVDKNNSKNIDLTHSSESSNDNVDGTINKATSPQVSYEYLGKKDDISIDYDEMFDEIVGSHGSKNSSINNSKSGDNDVSNINDIESTDNLSKSNCDLVSTCSQVSEVFEIVDEELNYSMNKSRHDNIFVENFEFGGISVLDDLSNARTSKSCGNNENIVCVGNNINRSMSESFLPAVNMNRTNNNLECTTEKYYHNETTTPFRPQNDNMFCGVTPANSDYIVKTDKVTPMVDYASMTTPERNKELDQYGLKPFKRKRGKLTSNNNSLKILKFCDKTQLWGLIMWQLIRAGKAFDQCFR